MSQTDIHSVTPAKRIVTSHPPAAIEFEGLLEFDGAEMYRLPAYDRLPPFMIALTSPSDHWMYLSSFGGLTAGRRDADHALFPYETEDRLNHLHGITGPITLIRAHQNDGKTILWEPFNHRLAPSNISRTLYKTILSDRIIFEETNPDLGLIFRYQWACSEKFGFIRTATLINSRPARNVRIAILDGLLNLLPARIPLIMQQSSSCLVDAYKRGEWDAQARMSIYSLSSVITDRPEPAEALAATAVWARGLAGAAISMNEASVADFRANKPIAQDDCLTGQRCAFLQSADFDLPAGMQMQWDIVADVDQDHAAIENRRHFLLHESDVRRAVAKEIQSSHTALAARADAADASQRTGDYSASASHAANVLFNNLRGGVSVNGYTVKSSDFVHLVALRNTLVAKRCEDFLRDLPSQLSLPELIEKTDANGDADLRRLAREYLPLTLSRRHGDPSRPWNRFNIRSQNADGASAIHYEGNWRDIFQNWEALAISYPELIESFISKFVNASTVDGFNPYRISDAGIDWEIHDPSNPWSNIGYWGDHQIIYLLKFLEASRRHHPQRISQLLTEAIFSYANVPYRLKPYADLIAAPRQTIQFDQELDQLISQRTTEIGADGKLLCDADGRTVHVNLLEKLLVPLLCKVSNLVLAGGIWMNTQRPEWNDANNALAGPGVSMVTLCYLRRYAEFLIDLLKPLSDQPAQISREVLDWLNQTGAALLKHSDLLRISKVDDVGRRRLLDDLGHAFENYRQTVYAHGFNGKVSCPIAEVLPMLRLTLSYLDYSIDANRRTDALYHAYNILHLDRSGGTKVEALQLMLEGQVAALSSSKVDSDEAIEILESLFASPLYRADQQSFILYPVEQAKSFLSRNQISVKTVEFNPLLKMLADSSEQSIIARDINGDFHFNAGFANSADLKAALDQLEKETRWRDAVKHDRHSVIDLYEDLFQHRRFTGRSGSMHAYEGIGSIYWHMIGKLLVAAQECFWQADRAGQPASQKRRLTELYYRIRDGLGFNKLASEYGAFPIDPHSHTPAGGGARQPGMTGQVKEDILRRFGELGVCVEDGCVRFRPVLLRQREFLIAPANFHSIPLPIGSLAFTYCGTPIVYRLADGPMQIRIVDAKTTLIDGDRLTHEQSRSLFMRECRIQRIEVDVPAAMSAFD